MFTLESEPWARALQVSDLPIAAELSRKLNNLGVESIGELIRIIKYDPIAEEDHRDLISAVRLVLTTAGNSAAVSLESAWSNLCSQNPFCSVSEIAFRRKCTPYAVLDLAKRVGVIGQLDEGQSSIYLVPEPESIDRNNSQRLIQGLADRLLKIDDRQFKVLKGRLQEGSTLEVIGQSLGLTRERARQIERKAKENLRTIASASEVLEAVIPIHYALENLGGRATIQELSREVGASPFSLSIAVELAANHPHFQDISLISGFETHLPLNFASLKKATDVLELSALDSITKERSSFAMGSSGVKRGSEYLRNLSDSIGEKISCTHTPILSTLGALEQKGLVAIGRVHPSEELEYGPWAIYPQTPRTVQIAQAILKVGSEEASKSVGAFSGSYFHSQDGVQNHLLTEQLFKSTGIRTMETSVNELCKRYPEIFVRSGPSRWGLIGAGAQYSDAKAEKKLDHGTTIDLLVEVLEKSSEPLPIHEIISRMRQIAPEIKEMSVRVYLYTLHADRFVQEDGLFTLSDSYLKRRELAAELPWGATIKILERVMAESNVPLALDEIVSRCQEHLPVDPAAIRSYLEQNYRNWFRKLPEGKYIRSEVV